MLPLLLIAYRSVAAIQDTGQTSQDVAAQELDNKSIEALQVRAQQAATQITELLTNVVEDTQYLTHLQPDATLYLEFYHSRSSQIWFQTGTPEAATQLIKQTPLYRELAYIDASGMEVLRIRNGAILPPQELRNVSDPANTTYLTETYFADTAAIASG